MSILISTPLDHLAADAEGNDGNDTPANGYYRAKRRLSFSAASPIEGKKIRTTTLSPAANTANSSTSSLLSMTIELESIDIDTSIEACVEKIISAGDSITGKKCYTLLVFV